MNNKIMLNITEQKELWMKENSLRCLNQKKQKQCLKV